MTRFRPDKRSFPFLTSPTFGLGVKDVIRPGKSKVVFSKLKQIYGEYLENYQHEQIETVGTQSLSNAERDRIKTQIRKEYRIQVFKMVISLLLAIGLAVILLLILVWVIELLLETNNMN